MANFPPFGVDCGYVSISNATFKAEGATTSTTTLSCASSMTVVGNSYYSAGDGNGANYASTIWLNSYANQGGAGGMSFVLDDNWNAGKVASAKLRIYPISKCNVKRSGDIYIRELDAYPSLTLTSTAYNTNHTVYQESSTTSSRYTFSTTKLATIAASGYDTGVPAKGAYYDIDLTDYFRSLSKSAGNSVYFGIDISGWAACISLGAYHNDYAPELVLTYNDVVGYDYTVVAKDGSGNELKVLDSGIYWTGSDAISLYYPQYILSGTTLYNINTSQGDTGDDYWFRTTFTPDADEYEKVLTYNNSTVSNVVYFAEAEDISGFSTSTSASINKRASGGQCARSGGSYKTLTTLGAGKYKVYLRGIADGDTRTANVKYGDAYAIESWAIGNGTNQTTNAEFTLTGNTTITIECSASSATGLDWVYIQKTGDVKSITSAGWATYCSPYALNLAEATGIDDAYIITGGTSATGVLSKTSVKDGTVAANTGLLLKGSEGTVTIPVVASGTDHSATNKLVGVTTATQIAAEAGYVLMNDATYGVAFYKNSNAFTVGANTAYLPANFDGSNAPAWFFSFEDSETTGIDMVHGAGLKVNGSVYNLNGQRVAQPTKGLYIVNGKKIIIK